MGYCIFIIPTGSVGKFNCGKRSRACSLFLKITVNANTVCQRSVIISNCQDQVKVLSADRNIRRHNCLIKFNNVFFAVRCQSVNLIITEALGEQIYIFTVTTDHIIVAGTTDNGIITTVAVKLVITA